MPPRIVPLGPVVAQVERRIGINAVRFAAVALALLAAIAAVLGQEHDSLAVVLVRVIGLYLRRRIQIVLAQFHRPAPIPIAEEEADRSGGGRREAQEIPPPFVVGQMFNDPPGEAMRPLGIAVGYLFDQMAVADDLALAARRDVPRRRLIQALMAGLEFFAASAHTRRIRESTWMNGMRVTVFLLLWLLAAAPTTVLGGEIDPDHFGTWAPVGKSCKSEPRIVVTAKEIIIHHQGRVQRFGDLDECYTCFSGGSIYSTPVITTSIYPWWGQEKDFPFILVFNPEEKKGTMRLELEDGNSSELPTDEILFQKCGRDKK